MGYIVGILIIAVIAYLYTQDKKKKKASSEPVVVPEPTTVAPSATLDGSYNLTVTPPDRNSWGDGTHPFEAKELEIVPSHRGQGYRLGGDMQIDRSNGVLSVVTTLWGNRIPKFGSTRVQIQPADGREVEFAIDGAWVYLMFGTDGSVTGRVFEPEGWIAGGYNRHNCWKYGDISGRKS